MFVESDFLWRPGKLHFILPCKWLVNAGCAQIPRASVANCDRILAILCILCVLRVWMDDDDDDVDGLGLRSLDGGRLFLGNGRALGIGMMRDEKTTATGVSKYVGTFILNGYGYCCCVFPSSQSILDLARSGCGG